MTDYERGFADAIKSAAQRAQEQTIGHNCQQMTTHQLCLHISKIIKEMTPKKLTHELGKPGVNDD
jgi:hypothetical protein